jgi:hypothetical protein
MINQNDQEEFYIGYAEKAPRGMGAIIRRVVIALIAITSVLAILLVFGQHRFAASFFEFGNVREFEGELKETPFPQLRVRRDGEARFAQPVVTYALVSEGKHGAAAEALGFDGHRVKLRGTLIHRDETAMIELVSGSISIAAPTPEPTSQMFLPETLSVQSLTGEIVDSKCYLGVMNPGHTKPHRECASLCIRGGIPPLFIAKDSDGRDVHLWLVSEKGEPVNQQVLDFVAEPIEITGQIKRSGDQLYLYANPQTFRRL